MSYDSAEVVSETARELEITFPLLADPESVAIDAWGVRNTKARGRTEGVARPIYFLIDAEGIVRGKLAHENYRKRHKPDEVLAALGALPSARGGPGLCYAP